MELLREQKTTITLEHERLLAQQDRVLNERDEAESRAKRDIEKLIQDVAEASVEKQNLDRTVTSLRDESDQLRRRVHELQRQSAAKDMQISSLEKFREQDRDDKEGLNLALESKQMELEMVGLISPLSAIGYHIHSLFIR